MVRIEEQLVLDRSGVLRDRARHGRRGSGRARGERRLRGRAPCMRIESRVPRASFAGGESLAAATFSSVERVLRRLSSVGPRDIKRYGLASSSVGASERVRRLVTKWYSERVRTA